MYPWTVYNLKSFGEVSWISALAFSRKSQPAPVSEPNPEMLWTTLDLTFWQVSTNQVWGITF